MLVSGRNVPNFNFFSFRISLLSALENEFSTDEVYLDKIRNLSVKFTDIRRTRPDGNCFFRYMK